MDSEFGNINFSEFSNLQSRFTSAEIPWHERHSKAQNNEQLQEFSDRVTYLTRSRRKASIRVNLSELIGLIYLTRTRKVAEVRTRLALLEIRERRKIAGRVGVFSLQEARKLLGSTRVSNKTILHLKDSNIEIGRDVIEGIAENLHQRNLSRRVWIPRRLIRYLASEGSRIEIGVALLLCLRRRYYRLQRSRLGTRLAAQVLLCGRQYIRAATRKLQEKHIIIKHQGAWWATKRYGTQYEIASDMELPTRSNVNRRVRNYKKLREEKNAKRYPLLKIEPRYIYLEQQQLICAAAAAASDHVFGFIEHQYHCGMHLAPDDPDLVALKTPPKIATPPPEPAKPLKAPIRHEEARESMRPAHTSKDELMRLEMVAAAHRKILQEQIDALAIRPAYPVQPPPQQWIPNTTAQCDERRAFLKKQAEEFMKSLEAEKCSTRI